jgi:hypothetical protein
VSWEDGISVGQLQRHSRGPLNGLLLAHGGRDVD